ncbi:PREDICTED: probable 18S rRNA (guanine-N(7))-methyltransferase isoform X1 [Myotis davidii]|uniref:probable 18S rRNA (guanine-N(7))-methyltransferase isoform X1 n=1 Tax=Myotis davidii TaxID=225400 RepID=UPI0007670ABA|nr:PREDICTED: probable 18S rRNA (guanine-N(7))-methyltransferase isoform X1 [Myotis davidii]
MACRGRRPEHGGPPELFYDQNEARKYMRNSRMIDVQTKMTGRALELLDLPDEKPCFLLDIGCGTGLSGDYLSDEGHYWVGIDISLAMLDAALDRKAQGDLLLGDMGQGIPFKPGSFDGCISISAVQWLCNANKKSDIPAKRLYCFFSSLYSVLVRGARAVLQLYPENSEQLELITTQAIRAGFTGGVVVDYPNSAKAKKFYLCLFSGPSTFLPKGLNEIKEEEEAKESTFTNKSQAVPSIISQPCLRHRVPYRIARSGVVRKMKTREWVLEKKERRRRQGKEVRPDTQYTGRKRKPYF